MKKYLIITTIIIIAYGWLPISFPRVTNTLNTNELTITIQQCGCSCPNAGIIEGELNIGEEWLKQYPQLENYTRQINTTANLETHDPIKLWELTGETDYFIKGRIVGVDTIFCEPNACELAARFEVNDLEAANYSPRFWLFGKTSFLGYWLFSLIGIISIINTGIKGIKQ